MKERSITADTATSRETARIRRFYEQYAASYDHWMDFYDRALLGDGRRRLCARATGDTLEIAVGTGLNLAHYPSEVRLTGMDLSPAMLVVAERRAKMLRREVDLRLSDAQALDFPAAHFDTVLTTLFLSTVPDDRRVAAEAWRVLKPGGRLLLLDHVRSTIGPVRWLEWLCDPLVARLTGVHLRRDPLDYLGAVGFTIERCARSKWGVVQMIVARKGS